MHTLNYNEQLLDYNMVLQGQFNVVHHTHISILYSQYVLKRPKYSQEFVRLVSETPTLLQRDETGGVSSANARSAVLHWFVCDAELGQVVTNHLRLFNRNRHRHIL